MRNLPGHCLSMRVSAPGAPVDCPSGANWARWRRDATVGMDNTARRPGVKCAYPRYRTEAHASVSACLPETPARDEDQASAGGQSASTALLHPWKAAVTLPLSPSMQLGHCNGHLAQPRLAPPFVPPASVGESRRQTPAPDVRSGREFAGGETLESRAKRWALCGCCCSDAAAKDARRGPVMASFAHRASVMSRRARGCRGAWRSWR